MFFHLEKSMKKDSSEEPFTVVKVATFYQAMTTSKNLITIKKSQTLGDLKVKNPANQLSTLTMNNDKSRK